MPTLEHHGLVDMFRGKPSLAGHLVDPAMLERWIGNVLGAKTAADVFG